MSKKEEVEQVFRSLVPKHTDDSGSVRWAELAQELEKRGITTVTGKPFTRPNAETWWRRNKDKIGSDSSEPLTDTTQEMPDSGQALTQTNQPLQVSDRPESQILTPSGDIVTGEQWMTFVWELWEVHKTGGFKEILKGRAIGDISGEPLMPEIKPDSKNPTSISVNKELMRVALEKAKKDKHNPSGTTLTVSGMVQFLAWQYIGSPETWPPRPDEAEAS